jgi:hypothetical protein
MVMTRPSKAGVVFLTLFGLVFFLAGSFFLFAMLRGLGTSQSGLPAAVAIALFFAATGAGLMYAAVAGYRRSKAQAALEESQPSSPWLWRNDWSVRRAVSRNKNRATGAWIVCILGNLFLLPFTLTMLPALARQGDFRAVFVFVFCCAGPALLIYAMRATIRQRRFGATYFEFYSLPFSPGGSLAGRIHLTLDERVENGVDLRLSCLRKTIIQGGEDSRTVETILWQSDKKIFAGALGRDASGATIPVDFEIPPDAYVTDLDNHSDQVIWVLHAEAEVPGVNYKDDFEVPVFRTSSSPSPQTASESTGPGFAAGSSDGDDAPISAPAKPKVIVSSQGGGTEFFFPALRVPYRALLLFVFTAIWTGFTYLLFRSDAPWVFPVVFGLSDIFLVVASVHILFGTARIRVGNGQITAVSTFLGISRTKRFSFSEVQAILPVTSGQTSPGSPPEYSIRLITNDRRRFTIASQIASRQEARWIVSQIETLAGLKVDTRVVVDSMYGPPPQPFVSGDDSSPSARYRLQQSRRRSPAAMAIPIAVFVFFMFGMFAFQIWRGSSFKSSANSRRASRPRVVTPAAPPAARVPFAPAPEAKPMPDSDAQRILALPPQGQAEELLERAIGHDPRALELFEQNIDAWVGHIHLTDHLKQLESRSQYSKDLRVRYANADIELTLDGWHKNEEAADILIERAKSDVHYRSAAVFFLGMLAGRGVAYDKIHPVLLDYAKHDPDASVRQWAVEGMRYLGTDEALDELFESFTQDSSMDVRQRAGCNISDCGNFTRVQRMRMVPKLLDLVSASGTAGQMRSWCFMALREITDASVPDDPQIWKNWYAQHGAEKSRQFQAQQWWQVRGDE